MSCIARILLVLAGLGIAMSVMSPSPRSSAQSAGAQLHLAIKEVRRAMEIVERICLGRDQWL